MAQKDMLGYSRETKAGRKVLASSDYAVISVGSDPLNLVQSVNASFGHQVISKFESGSSDLFWQTGQSQGKIDFGRLVGMGGFLDQLKEAFGNACGKLVKLNVDLSGASSCSVGVSPKKSKLTFDGAIPENYSFNWSAGGLDINEGGSIRVSSLIVT